MDYEEYENTMGNRYYLQDKNKIYKVRFHRGGLTESMETYFEPKDWKDFIKHVKQEDKNIIIRSIKCELYFDEPDWRIDWAQTWVLTSKYKGLKSEYVFAFSNRDIFELRKIK